MKKDIKIVNDKKKPMKLWVKFLIFTGISIIIGILIGVLGGRVGQNQVCAFVGTAFIMLPLVVGFFLIFYVLIKDSKKREIEAEQNPQSRRTASSEKNTSSYQRKLSNDQIIAFDKFIEKNFPELPLDDYFMDLRDFYGDHTYYVRQRLQAAMRNFQAQLGLNNFVITLVFSDFMSTSEAGSFKRTNLYTGEITINSTIPAQAGIATLAHEMSHAYQSFKGKEYPVEKDKEAFTDILTYYLGFEKIVSYGYFSETSTGVVKIGYIELGDFNFARTTYSKRASAPNSYKKEKDDLKSRLDAYCYYLEVNKSLTEQLLVKYLPEKDKSFVEACLKDYTSDETKQYIEKIKNSYLHSTDENLKMDSFGIEMRVEKLFEDNKKLQSIYSFIYSK